MTQDRPGKSPHSAPEDHEDKCNIRLERVTCPRCRTSDCEVMFEGEDYLHGVPGTFYASRCKECGLWYQNPRPIAADIPSLYPSDYAPHTTSEAFNESTLSDNTINRGMKGYLRRRYFSFLHKRMGYPHIQNENRRQSYEPIGALLAPLWKRFATFRLIPHFVPGGRLLEIGCGNGDYLSDLREKGWKNLAAIELVPAAADMARRRGFAVKCGIVEEMLGNYEDNTFDVIAATMVLEHLIDPFAVVEEIAAKLKPGGEFMFSTIVRNALDLKFFGKYWRAFDFPRHLIYFQESDTYNMLNAHFEKVQHVHHAAPLDFIMPTGWRGTALDCVVGRLARSFLGQGMCGLLAALGLTACVSFRCRKR